ncbi:hypothetical protein KBD45_06035 [Candidatus Dojkabacteria bacterium]|nr:hypothetical protein [Candidatus Dojkabacteria bacterium]
MFNQKISGIIFDYDGVIENSDPFHINALKYAANNLNLKFIEDAPLGIQAAKKANIKCIALEQTHSTDELKKAELIIEDLSKLIL